jgi:hypothetical protein
LKLKKKLLNLVTCFYRHVRRQPGLAIPQPRIDDRAIDASEIQQPVIPFHHGEPPFYAQVRMLETNNCAAVAQITSLFAVWSFFVDNLQFP